MQRTDRRRLLFAAIVTLVALPVLLVLRKSEPGAADTAGTGAAAVPPPTRLRLAPPTLPDYMRIKTVDEDKAAKINRAPKPSGKVLEATAGFKDLQVSIGSPCTTPFAPFGTRLTVRNVDNNVSIVCTNVSTKSSQTTTIVLDQDLFRKLADLVEAPISVEITWK